MFYILQEVFRDINSNEFLRSRNCCKEKLDTKYFLFIKFKKWVFLQEMLNLECFSNQETPKKTLPLFKKGISRPFLKMLVFIF